MTGLASTYVHLCLRVLARRWLVEAQNLDWRLNKGSESGWILQSDPRW